MWCSTEQLSIVTNMDRNCMEKYNANLDNIRWIKQTLAVINLTPAISTNLENVSSACMRKTTCR